MRPGAHAAGAAAVPEDPGEGERRAGVGRGARGAGVGSGGAAAGWTTPERMETKAPARCPEDPVATLRGRRAPRRLDLSHYL